MSVLPAPELCEEEFATALVCVICVIRCLVWLIGCLVVWLLWLIIQLRVKRFCIYVSIFSISCRVGSIYGAIFFSVAS